MSRPLALMAFVGIAVAGGAAPLEFWEHRGAIVAEFEDASLRSAEVSSRADASGGKVVGWKDEHGRAEFALRVSTPGVWHVWIRTAAKDHVSNGLFLELDGVRQRAPAGHPWAGADSIYLRKHPTHFSWKPEWQGPGEGNHAGPITVEIPRAGLHRLAIVARKIERPTLDKIVLTLSATADFASNGASLGPIATARQPLSGQLLVHPQNTARLARFRAAEECADVPTPTRATGFAAIIARENRPGLPLVIHHATGGLRLQRPAGIAAECAVPIMSQ